MSESIQYVSKKDLLYVIIIFYYTGNCVMHDFKEQNIHIKCWNHVCLNK